MLMIYLSNFKKIFIFLLCALCASAVLSSSSEGACKIAPGLLKSAVMRYAPVIVQGPEIPAEPGEMLYRAATSADGKILFLAYHVVWPYEKDPRSGVWPAITRATYTGGLQLQSVIYGPGDVEVIEIRVDLTTMKMIRINYETARYDEKGAVIHTEVVKEKDELPDLLPLSFEVVSWNHLFELMDRPPTPNQKVYRLEPEPFTEGLWSYYRMSKSIRTPLSRDRDQQPWETGEICEFP